MLIKLFGVPEAARSGELAKRIEDVVLGEMGTASMRVGFSPIPIRRNGDIGAIRFLVTGSDAHGIERRVIRIAANACEAYFRTHGIEWPGFEDPQLPGQP